MGDYDTTALEELMERYDRSFDRWSAPTAFARGSVEYEYRKTLQALQAAGYRLVREVRGD